MTNLHISQQEAAAELLRRRKARAKLAPYIDYLDIGFVPAAHHQLLLSELEGLERGDIDRLMVLMPPGSAKSTYTSVLFPPWFMGRNPGKAVLGVSNTTELAERFSRRSRAIVGSPRWRNLFGATLKEDSAAAGNWETTADGEFFAAGVGSAIAGRRADLGLIDDPIKTRAEADSESVRAKQWDWYVNDFLTRLKPGARQILIQTRWHEDDLGGRILQREAHKWKVLCLPMEALPNDPLGRPVGQRLWAEWFTEDMVATAKQDVRAWNALYQQDPAPEDGDFFKREWFGQYTVQPETLHVYGASDYAVTEGGGDYTEHGVFGVDWNGDIYVLDWWYGKTRSDEWIERQIDLMATWGPLVWFGEAGPIKKAIEPFLKRRMEERRTYCTLEWLPSIADKPTRMRSFQARAGMSKVYVPPNPPWLAHVMGNLLKFPGGKHDDAADVCSLVGRGLDMMPTPAKPQPAKKRPPMVVSGRMGWAA